MSLTIVKTTQEQLVSTPVLRGLRDGVERDGSAVLLVPSFGQALDAQRVLAAEQGLALAVTTTTPSAWVRERWEVWGDGRSIADATVLTVLAREAILQATPEELGSLELSVGVVHVLEQLVGQSLPWLPLDEAGAPRGDVCAAAGLTQAETRLIGLAGKVRTLLAQRGYVSAADATWLVPTLLQEAQVRVPPIVVAGQSFLPRVERELLLALARITTVILVVFVDGGPATQQAEELAAWFVAQGNKVPVVVQVEHREENLRPSQSLSSLHGDSAPSQMQRTQASGCSQGLSCGRDADDMDAPRRVHELDRLLAALFGDGGLDPRAAQAVELLLPAGPVAEAELVAQKAQQLAIDGAADVVVAVPDVARAQRELIPKLAARGLSVRYSWSTPLVDCPAAQAFFAFARTVAQLVELDASWPQPVMGMDGLMAQLGDMSWWPPRELSDFLLSDIAHVASERAWWTDAVWRGNRLLSPARLLTMLQTERDTSGPVARATAELLRGRVGTAASKLLLPYVEALETRASGGEGASADDGLAQLGGAAEDADAQARAVLQAILQLAGTLRELGVTADPSVEGSVSLAELVELLEWEARSMSVTARVGVAGSEAGALVTVMSMGDATRLAPGSVDALVACGLTTAEQPIAASDTLLQALLERLEVEPAGNPMAQARARFRALVAAPRTRLVLERALHDADAKVTYPSVMLSELLAAYGIGASVGYKELPLPKATFSETKLADNLTVGSVGLTENKACNPAPAGRLTDASRGLVFVPQDGNELLPDAKPILSASQIETYLDCPYKWFSLRRLRLGTVDAGHTGMEMGTFAHRVLEVTHRELLARALEAQNPDISRDLLLQQIEADPACHVAGSRVDDANLEAACAALNLEFDLHHQHMYMVKRPRLAQQLLIAHNASERAQEDQLRQDLLSSLQYQTRILQGFEPRLFEWSFGRHDNLVEYAGAYFTGTVDRIDVSPHGTAVIIDYKHKSPAGFAAEYDALQEGVLEGEVLPNRVQSLIYAQVVRRAFEGRLRLVGSVYLSTKSPHALAGVADDTVTDLVFGKVSSQRLPRVSVPRTAEGESGMNALLDQTEELVAQQVQQMLAGNVEARPRDARSCDFCPVMQCERRERR